MKRSLPFILLFALLSFTHESSFAQSKAKNKTEADYWKETGISIKGLENGFFTECYFSKASFAGCVAALNVLAESLPTPQVFATDEEVAQNIFYIGKRVQPYAGGMSLYEVKQIASSEVTDWNAQIEENKKSIRIHAKAIENLFNAHRPDTFPFLDTVEQLRNNVLVGNHAENDAVLAATMYNQFLAATVDPHTHISPLIQMQEKTEHSDDQQSFFEIGITLQKKSNQIMVGSVISNGPAMRAGFHARDVLLEVDGITIADSASVDETRSMIIKKGAAPVCVTVLRNGEKLFLEVTPADIRRLNVESKIVDDFGVSYGYILLRDFMDESASVKIKAALIDFKSKNVNGIILDLRDNPGGLLTEAVKISTLFVGKETIVTTKTLNNKVSTTFGGTEDRTTDLPMVTLINAGSASASEVVSGALQDHKRSWILGDRSFGKGSVQSVQPLEENPKILLAKTIQRFYQPSGRTNQIQGILPDFYIDPFPNAKAIDKVAMREEDLYTNALPALNEPWVETRADVLAAKSVINQCRTLNAQNKTGLDAIYELQSSSMNQVNPPDYRLLAAEEVLNCARP